MCIPGAQSDSEVSMSATGSEAGESRGYTSDSELYESQSKHHHSRSPEEEGGRRQRRRHDRDQTQSFPRQLATGKLLNYFIDLLVFTVYHVDIALMN